jgi:hypothetical protein
MMRDQAHDALAIGGRQRLTRIGQPFGEPVDPERPSGFSITSTTAGSSRRWAMAEPSAVRSMRAPRANASGFWLILVIFALPTGRNR